MSRKKKPKPAARPPASADTAGALPRAGHFKESIEHFKDLLKKERRAEWLEGLAAAYAGRAEQLAAKGMVNEALALWRTRAEACQVPLLEGPYIGWLMQTGNTQQALALLPQLSKLPDAARDQARIRLAPALLAAPDALVAGLSEEDRSQRAAARAALAACTSGDTAALDAALPAISFRSPYRDLRPLLKAVSLLGSDRDAAASALARVPANGPFEAMAAALRVCLLPRGEWLAGLRGLDDAGRGLVLELEGCPPPQRPFVLELAARAGTPASPPAELLELLLRHRRELPEAVTHRNALRLLPHAPQRLNAVRAAGLALPPAEQERVLALAAELKLRPDEAEDHWLRLIDLLAKAPAGPQRAALVLRRLADGHSGHAAEGALCRHAQGWLERSLSLDPADSATALRLVRSARAEGDLKAARRLLDATRERLPDDTPLLLEAVEVALAAGSFKKAAGLAKQVLQSDPINPRVRSVVGQAHLSHARKQIVNRNQVAAQRELDEAANWLRGSSERGVLALLRGLIAASPPAGDLLLREAVAELGGPLVGAFHLLLEARRVKHQAAARPADLLRRAGVDLAARPDAAQVVALARALHEVPQTDAELRAALGVLGDTLERAAGQIEFSESDHLLVCEALHRHHLAALTRRFAATALARWPKRPAFVYLEAAARFGAEPWMMPADEWKRLDSVYAQAKGQGDQRTAARLSRLLDEAGGHDPWPARLHDFDDEDFDDDDDDDDDDEDEDEDDDEGEPDIAQIIAAVGGQDAFLEVMRKQLGATAFDKLQRELKGNKTGLAQLLATMLAASGEISLPILPRQERRKAARKAGSAAQKQKGLFDD